jgi:hypothetical protein
MARAFCLSVVLLTFSVAACGGDDDDTAAAGGSAGTPNLNLGGSGGSGAQSSSTAGDTSTPADGGAATAGSSSANGGQPASGGSAGTGGNGLYLPCESAADCKKYGGGKICCATAAMHFCTKQSACTGKILP